MFIDITAEKIAKLALVAFLSIFGVYSTLMLDEGYLVSKRALITIDKSRAQLSYNASKFRERNSMNPNTNIASVWAGSEDGTSTGILQGITVWGNTQVSRNAESIPVLVYHGIPEEGLGIVDQNKFIGHLKALKNDGWQTVRLNDLYRFMRGEVDLPDKSFVLTFDDGRKDSYYPVDPVLKDLGYTAVMFIISGDSIDRNREVPSTYYLSETEIRDMEKSGRWELESHGKFAHRLYAIAEDGKEGYFLGNKLWLGIYDRLETDDEFRKRVKRDLQESHDELEIALSKDITAFAYPFSEYGQHSVNFKESESILKEIIPNIYKMSFYQVNKSHNELFNYKGHYNQPLGWMIKRIEPNNDWTSTRLLEEMNSARAKSLPYSTGKFGREWIATWGVMTETDNLFIKASSDGTGGSAYLNGTSHWDNYLYSADVSWSSSTHFMLTARHKDRNSYIICDFSSDRVSVRSKIDGEGEGIVSEKIARIDPMFGLKVSMKVEDDGVSCWLGNKRVVLTKVPEPLIGSGGVGVEVWNPELGTARAWVRSVEISNI